MYTSAKHRGWLTLMIILAVLSGCLHIIGRHIIVVHGISMEPALHNGDIVVINKQNDTYSIGDIVIVKDNRFGRNYVIKRIAARGGQVIMFNYENNTILVDEDETPSASLQLSLKNVSMEAQNGRDIESYQVPDNHVFLIGDNLNHSIDSRLPEIGCIKRSSIVGKVVFHLGSLCQ